MARAPSMVSSEGCPISTTVPCHWLLRAASSPCRAEQHSHVDVVPAGVHHAHILPLLVGRADG